MTRARDLADGADKDITGTLTLDDIVLSNDMSVADNGKVQFGAGNDLQIYHEASSNNSIIAESGSGNLRLHADDLYVFNAAGTSVMISALDTGKVGLGFSGSEKLATTSTGIDVTGTAVTDGLTVAGNVSVDGGTIKLDGNYPTGTNNVALGDTALDSLASSSTRNTAIGFAAGTALTTQGYNVFVGSYSGDGATGSFNVAVGDVTLRNASGSYNTAIGSEALYSNTTASDNTAAGYKALYANTTGTYNAAVGRSALQNNITASYNTATGYQALKTNTTGISNDAHGANTLVQNTTGNYNAGFGNAALNLNTTGSSNTALGYFALRANTTASNNTAVGYQAGYSNTTSAGNVFLGYFAGNASTGASNTYVGSGAGYLMTTGARNTILGQFSGNQGGLDIRTSSNRIVISDGDGNPRMFCDNEGMFCIGDDNTQAARLKIRRSGGTPIRVFNSGGTSGFFNQIIFMNNGDTGEVGSIKRVNNASVQYNTTSDARLKDNIADMTGAIARVKLLKPKRYSWIEEDLDAADQDGFLAHETQTVVPGAVSGTQNEVDDDGNAIYMQMDYSKLVPVLTAALKEAITKIETLETKVAALEAN